MTQTNRMMALRTAVDLALVNGEQAFRRDLAYGETLDTRAEAVTRQIWYDVLKALIQSFEGAPGDLIAVVADQLKVRASVIVRCGGGVPAPWWRQ